MAVLGAGGTGRTAVAALAHYGATVVVYNRTRERADALAAEFNGKTGKVVAARLEKLCDSCCQIYINTTSVGMHPNVSRKPAGRAAAAVLPDTLVFDTVYNPMETAAEAGRAAGPRPSAAWRCSSARPPRQFETWTVKAAPDGSDATRC